jgi:hypothetical protein
MSSCHDSFVKVLFKDKQNAHDAYLVCEFLANGACLAANKGTLRIQNESERIVLFNRILSYLRQGLRKLQPIRCPGSSQEYEVEELHAL